jgi:energy-converting hydrogenase Eha subunit E
MSDDDIDVIIISTILGSMPKASDEAKAKLVVNYWRDAQRSAVRHPVRSFIRAPLLTKIGVSLILLAWLSQLAVSVYLVTTL